MIKSVVIFSIVLFGSVFFSALFWSLAEDPQRILDETASAMPAEKIPVRLPVESIETPASKELEIEPIAAADNLAPEPMGAEAMSDLGFGTAYGAGSGGVGIAGGGGFGSDQAQLIRDGGIADRPPRVLSRGALEYPQEAKSKGLTGYVVVKVHVEKTGAVTEVIVTEGKPKGVFDAAVIRSVQGWRFEPGISKGQIVSMWTSQRVRFELE